MCFLLSMVFLGDAFRLLRFLFMLHPFPLLDLFLLSSRGAASGRTGLLEPFRPGTLFSFFLSKLFLDEGRQVGGRYGTFSSLIIGDWSSLQELRSTSGAVPTFLTYLFVLIFPGARDAHPSRLWAFSFGRPLRRSFLDSLPPFSLNLFFSRPSPPHVPR